MPDGRRLYAAVSAVAFDPLFLWALAVAMGLIAHVNSERGEWRSANALTHAVLSVGLFVAAALRRNATRA